MWVKLLQDAAQSVTHAAAAAAGGAAAAAAGGGAAAGGSAGSSPRQATVQLPPDCIQALMTVAAEQLQVGWAVVCTVEVATCWHAVHSAGSLQAWQDPGRKGEPSMPTAPAVSAEKHTAAAAPLPPQKRGHVPQEDEEFPPYFDTFAVGQWLGKTSLLGIVQWLAHTSVLHAHSAAERNGCSVDLAGVRPRFAYQADCCWGAQICACSPARTAQRMLLSIPHMPRPAGLQGGVCAVPRPPLRHSAPRRRGAAGAGAAGGATAAGCGRGGVQPGVRSVRLGCVGVGASLLLLELLEGGAC